MICFIKISSVNIGKANEEFYSCGEVFLKKQLFPDGRMETQMQILDFGGGERLRFCREYLSGMTGEVKTLILLPIPSTKDNIHVKGTETALSEAVSSAGRGDAVCGYGLPETVKGELAEKGVRLFDGLDCEDFLVENAVLTVDGALGELLSSMPFSLRDLSVGIIGYGRIGKRLLRSLLFLGAKVRVYTRSELVRLSLGEEGIESEAFSFDGDYVGLDVLVNTAPAKVMSSEGIKKYESAGLKILDLASGECFPQSPSVKKLASIPEAFYPKSAGRLYGKYISEYLRLEKK